ncbi:MAG: UDP-glucose 4-epimerase GalE [Clostridia bacterium]|nr:UDP-glucose 4-epimerase GalE [Clostridia bacterium]
MKILVTGGIGFIGSHTVVELIENGHDVVIVDNLSNSSVKVLDDIQKIAKRRPVFYEADIRDKAAMERVFTENKIDAVIHFAGLKAVGESIQIPMEYYHNNITGTLVLCDVMRTHGCKTIVFSSSATVYGMNNVSPFKEDMPTSCTNPYGWTKLMLEQILTDIAHSDPEWSVVLLRYFNPIGAHPSGIIGENPSGIPNNLFPYLARVAAGILPCLSIYGNDYDTPDGTGVRDYIHVVDLAQGHLKALNYATEHKGAEAINLGTSRGTSVLELVKAFEKANGVKVKYKIVERRPGDIATCYADTAKATELLGWSAKYGIEDMCRHGWNYMNKK